MLKRIHYHIEDCRDDHLGVELAEHFGLYLLANAAQVLYTMRCGNGNTGGDHSTMLKMLQMNNNFLLVPHPSMSPGISILPTVYVSLASYGLSIWCDCGPELMVETLPEEMWKLSNSKIGQSLEVEDAVVHLKLGNALESGLDKGTGLLPFCSYSRLLSRIENEKGPLETTLVVN